MRFKCTSFKMITWSRHSRRMTADDAFAIGPVRIRFAVHPRSGSPGTCGESGHGSRVRWADARFSSAGFPAPIQLESLAVPPDDGFRLHDDECRLPVRPKLGKPHPEDPIAWTQLRAFDRLLEHRHLLSQCQVLDRQPGFGNEHRSEEQNTRFENAHFRTREIRKWAIVAARPRAVANDVSPCQ